MGESSNNNLYEQMEKCCLFANQKKNKVNFVFNNVIKYMKSVF